MNDYLWANGRVNNMTDGERAVQAAIGANITLSYAQWQTILEALDTEQECSADIRRDLEASGDDEWSDLGNGPEIRRLRNQIQDIDDIISDIHAGIKEQKAKTGVQS